MEKLLDTKSSICRTGTIIEEVPKPAIRRDRVDAFKALHARWKECVAWFVVQYRTHVFPDGSRRFNPELETKLKRFDVEVQDPMDAAWRELTDAEKEATGC